MKKFGLFHYTKLLGIILLLSILFLASCARASIAPLTTTVMATQTETKAKATTPMVNNTAVVATTVPAITTHTTTATQTTTVPVASPPLSFNAATYRDTTYAYIFQYKSDWTIHWGDTATNPVAQGGSPYYDPSVRIYVLPQATGATFDDVLKSSAFVTALGSTDISGTIKLGTTKADMTNVYGTKATPIFYTYTHADGTTAICEGFGTIQSDKWFIMEVTISSGWGLDLSSTNPEEIFSTWEFNISAPPKLPTGHTGLTTCLDCHATGIDGAPLPKASVHTGFTDANHAGVCLSCH